MHKYSYEIVWRWKWIFIHFPNASETWSGDFNESLSWDCQWEIIAIDEEISEVEGQKLEQATRTKTPFICAFYFKVVTFKNTIFQTSKTDSFFSFVDSPLLFEIIRGSSQTFKSIILMQSCIISPGISCFTSDIDYPMVSVFRIPT